jgi:hypothetical protein
MQVTGLNLVSTKFSWRLMLLLLCVPGDGGAEHVLLIDGFSPLIQTKDLEDLLRPYSSKVSIRWIDDTSVAAVFRTPALGNDSFDHLYSYADNWFVSVYS